MTTRPPSPNCIFDPPGDCGGICPTALQNFTPTGSQPDAPCPKETTMNDAPMQPDRPCPPAMRCPDRSLCPTPCMEAGRSEDPSDRPRRHASDRSPLYPWEHTSWRGRNPRHRSDVNVRAVLGLVVTASQLGVLLTLAAGLIWLVARVTQ